MDERLVHNRAGKFGWRMKGGDKNAQNPRRERGSTSDHEHL
jgi:hypothetical protein